MGILDKLFGKGKPAQRDGLAEALWPVSAISPEMYGRMVGWVRSGDGPEILLELERQPNPALASVLASPAHLDISTWIRQQRMRGSASSTHGRKSGWPGIVTTLRTLIRRS